MNKILEFLKRSDFLNKNYAQNIYQTNERKRLEEHKNIIEKKSVLFISILMAFLTLFSQKLSLSFQPSIISTLFFLIFLVISIYITVKLYNKYITSMKEDEKGESEIINKLIFHEFLKEVDSLYGFKPNEELLLKINLIAKEPFKADGEKIDNISKILNDYKKDNLFEEFESKSSPAKKTAAIKKAPIKKPVTTKKATAVKKPVVTKKAVSSTNQLEEVKAVAKSVKKEAIKKPAIIKKATVKKPVKTAKATTIAKKAPIKPKE